PHLYLPRIVALVFPVGLLWHETRRELALAWQVLPSVRRHHRSSATGRDRLVPLVALAEPRGGCGVEFVWGRGSAPSKPSAARPASSAIAIHDGAGYLYSIGRANCDATNFHSPLHFRRTSR